MTVELGAKYASIDESAPESGHDSLSELTQEVTLYFKLYTD